jgi:hypothetical protein
MRSRECGVEGGVDEETLPPREPEVFPFFVAHVSLSNDIEAVH